MHIPDSMIGPQTTLPAFAVMAGFWGLATAKLQRSLRLRQVPLLALGAAFSFVIMMFNIPILGGTSGHAVGAVLIAVLLGPWAAVIAVSLALIVQAMLFSDGGIMAIGANCLNMAVVMPFVGWGIYRLIAGTAPASSRRHWIGAACGGYAGLSAAAITTGILFGIQPLIALDAAGRPMYSPFPLQVAVPAMAIEHLLVFGFVEALVTGWVVRYLQRTAPEMLPVHAPAGRALTLVPRLALALGVLVLLAPLGIYLPRLAQAGAAWGEWGTDELPQKIAEGTGRPGYLPEGARRAERHGWRALLPAYALPGQEEAPLAAVSFSYILSGVVGVLGLGGLVWLFRRCFLRKDPDDRAPGVDAPGPA